MIYNESNKRQEKIEEENMKKLVAKLLVASVVLSGVPFSHSVSAEVPISGILQNGNIEINETNFPDPVVCEKVKAFDKDGNNVLSQQEREAVTSIFWQDANIQDTTGISLFQNVQYVDLSGNPIKTIDTSNWTKLKALYLMNTQLTSIDVSNNPALEILHLLGSYALTGGLNLQSNSNLEQLHVNDTSITSIMLPDTSALVALNAGYNPHLTTIVYPKVATGSAIRSGLQINGQELYQQDQEKEKGTYLQWTIIKDGQSRVLDPNETVSAYGYTATAEWKKKTYTLTYRLPQGIQWASDDKKNKAVQSGVYGDPIKLPAKDSFTIENGYEWKGWKVSYGSLKDGTLTVFPSKNGMQVIVSPEVSRVQTSGQGKPTYTARFEKGEGDVKGFMPSMEGEVGTYLTFPESQYTREGYHFVGWKYDGGIYQAGKYKYKINSAGDNIFIAQWEANTGTIFAGERAIPVSKEKAGVYTLTEEDLKAQTKEGYQFNGWMYQGKRLKAGDTIVMYSDGEKVTLEANWNPNRYFVEYLQENGTPIKTDLLTYGVATDSYQLSDKENEVFVGWKRSGTATYAKSSVAREDGIYYSSEALLNLTSINGDTVRLEPVYKEKNRQMVVDGQLGSYTYTGTQITPTITVKVGEQLLTEGVDYKLEYSDNVNAGVAKVAVIPLKSEYDGTVVTFEIKKAPADNLKNVVVVTQQKNEQEEYFIAVQAPNSATVRYRLEGESAWSSVVPKISVGTAIIEYEITDPNYTGAYIGKVEVTVPKKDDNNSNGNSDNNTGNGNNNGSSSNGGSSNNNGSSSNGGNSNNGGNTNNGGSGATGGNSSSNGNNSSGGGSVVAPIVPSVPNAPSNPAVPNKPSTPDVSTKPENSNDKKEDQKPNINKGFDIPKIESQVFTGKKVSPNLVIKVGSKTLVKGKDYKITYKNNNKIGKATAIITGIGDYKGMSTTYSFVINPKKPTVQTKIGKSSIKITIKAQKGTKQMIQYSKNGGKTWKTIKTSAKTKTIKGLKKGTYKIRVCSYKIVKGVTYKSAYTTKSTVKIK